MGKDKEKATGAKPKDKKDAKTPDKEKKPTTPTKTEKPIAKTPEPPKEEKKTNGKVEEKPKPETDTGKTNGKSETTDDVKVEETKKDETPAPKKNIVLTYFDGSGRAELARLIMSAAEMDFEDKRIDSQEWKQLKPDTPFRQLPILEYHGQTLAQSMAIARFLAKKAGFYGGDDLEQAKVDMIVDYISDYNNKWVGVFRAKCQAEQLELIDDIVNVFMPVWFDNIAKLIEESGGKYLLGDKMTYADIYLFQVLQALTDPEDPFFTTLPPDVDARFHMLQFYPQIQKHKNAVYENPGIKKWTDNKPKGLF